MMTIIEVGQMLDLLRFNYGPSLYQDYPKEQLAEYWEKFLANENPEIVAYAVKLCVEELQFPPRIADILQRIKRIKRLKTMTDMEAFQRIKEAVEKSGGSKENQDKAFYSLPEILQKVVVRPKQLKDWRVVSPETFEGFIMPQITRTFRQLADREEIFQELPEGLQENLKSIEAPAEEDVPSAPKWIKQEWEKMRDNDETPLLSDKQQALLDKFVAPMTEEEKKAIEHRLNPHAEQNNTSSAGFFDVSSNIRKMFNYLIEDSEVSQQ